jgi:hypothetical protein
MPSSVSGSGVCTGAGAGRGGGAAGGGLGAAGGSGKPSWTGGGRRTPEADLAGRRCAGAARGAGLGAWAAGRGAGRARAGRTRERPRPSTLVELDSRSMEAGPTLGMTRCALSSPALPAANAARAVMAQSATVAGTGRGITAPGTASLAGRRSAGIDRGSLRGIRHPVRMRCTCRWVAVACERRARSDRRGCGCARQDRHRSRAPRRRSRAIGAAQLEHVKPLGAARP